MPDIHVVPVNDLIEHVEWRQCVCRPDVDDNGVDAIVVHHSADGREYFERSEEQEL